MLPASCNWYSSSVADISTEGLLAYGSRNLVHFCTFSNSMIVAHPAIIQSNDKVGCVSFINGGKGLAISSENNQICFYNVTELPVENTTETSLKPYHTIQTSEKIRGMACHDNFIAFCDYVGATYLVVVNPVVQSPKMIISNMLASQCGTASCIKIINMENKIITITGHAKGSLTVAVSQETSVFCSKFTEHRDSITSMSITITSPGEAAIVSVSNDRQIFHWKLTLPETVNSDSDVTQMIQKIGSIATIKTKSQGSVQPIRFSSLTRWESGEGEPFIISSFMNTGQIKGYSLKKQNNKSEWQPLLNTKRQTSFWWIGIWKDTVVTLSTDHCIRAFDVSTATIDGDIKICCTAPPISLQTMCGPAFCLSSGSSMWAAGTAYNTIKISTMNVDIAVKDRVTSICVHQPVVVFGLHSGVVGCFRIDQGARPHIAYCPMSGRHKGAVYVTTFIPSRNEIYSVGGGADSKLHIHQITYGRKLSIINTKFHSHVGVTSVGIWSHQKQYKIIIGFKDGTVSDIDNPKNSKRLQISTGKINRISALNRSTQSLSIVALCSSDGCIALSDLECSKVLCRSDLHKLPVIDIKWSPSVSSDNPFMLSSSYDGTVQLWKYLESDNQLVAVKSFRTHSSKVFAAIFLSTETALSCSDDNTIRIHSLVPNYGGGSCTAPPENPDMGLSVSRRQLPLKNKQKRSSTATTTSSIESITSSALKWDTVLARDGVNVKRPKIDVQLIESEITIARNANQKSEIDMLLYSLGKVVVGQSKTVMEKLLQKVPSYEQKASPLNVISSLLCFNDTTESDCGIIQSMGIAMSPLFGSQVHRQLLTTISTMRPGMAVYSSVCLAAAGDVESSIKLLLQSGLESEAALTAHANKNHLKPDVYNSLIKTIFSVYKPQSATTSVMSSLAAGQMDVAMSLIQNLNLSSENSFLFEIGCHIAKAWCQLDVHNPKRIYLLNQVRDSYASVCDSVKSGSSIPLYHGIDSKVNHPILLLHLNEKLTFDFPTEEFAYRSGCYIWSLSNKSNFFSNFMIRKTGACLQCWRHSPTKSHSKELVELSTMLLTHSMSEPVENDLNVDYLKTLINLHTNAINKTPQEIINEITLLLK